MQGQISFDGRVFKDDNIDEFEFNQDQSFDLENDYRSPGWDRLKKKLLKWKK